jgi:diacylglycerol kinase (ATP)
VHDNPCDLGRLRALKLPPTAFTTGGSKTFGDWSVQAPPGSTPLIVFINKKSGGQQGPGVIRRFCMHINPNQIMDLAGGGPAPGLKMFKDVPNFKVLACGGDGTVAWVLDVLDKLELPYVPPVAPLPLGTANDLSRTLGWGDGYEGEPVKDILKDLEKAQIVLMDRWILNMNEKDLNSGEFSVEKPRKIINNYFSIGIDAKIALSFHTKREESPKKFKSRTVNKIWYAKFGADAMFDAGSCDDLPKKIKLEVDDREIVLPDDVQGVMCTNLQSYMGGVDLWSNSSGKGNKPHYEPATIDDKLLEIVAIKGSLHLGQVKTGTASTVKITQGSKVKITWLTDENIPFQIDGEPWSQPPCTLTVSHHNQAKMLAHPKRLASGKIKLSPRPGSLESNTNKH